MSRVAEEMSRVAEFYFLCELLSRIPSERRPLKVSTDDFSWVNFISLAHEYRVSSAVALAMEACEFSKSPPKAAIDYFTGIAAYYRRRNERIRDEAIEVATILNRIAITPVFMKGGAHMLAGLYADISMRQMADLDILVPATSIDDCVAALATHGIKQAATDIHPRSHHYRPLGRSDLPVVIELHHEVLAYPRGEFLTSDEVRASMLKLENSGAQFAVPSPACAVIHNISHSQLGNHDYVYGSVDLRSLLDLALLSRAHRNRLDWAEISERFIRRGWRYAWEYHVSWARRLGADVPPLESTSAISRLFYRRAIYHVRAPKMLNLNFRLLRPWFLLRRELADAGLRRRLVGNLMRADWWKRHLGMLFR
jgi:Uncharacterised nucleotidyltransferase